MIIETTIYMAMDIRKKLDEAAVLSAHTRSDLIIRVMKKLLNEYEVLYRTNRATQYQERSPGERKRRLHVTLPAVDYDYFQDMRKFYRQSVSLLVKYAIEKYLVIVIEEILNKIQGKTTGNYSFENYILTREMFDDVVCWSIYWGIPQDPEIIFRN